MDPDSFWIRRYDDRQINISKPIWLGRRSRPPALDFRRIRAVLAKLATKSEQAAIKATLQASRLLGRSGMPDNEECHDEDKSVLAEAAITPVCPRDKVPDISCILELPADVLLEIIDHLELHDEFFLSQTCRPFRVLIGRDWKRTIDTEGD
ncbi:f-box domain containing protein [Colletotrichum sojae]|uniref:F-box domain containing protein n=1 Tax=Colletotrichum sojae TaxID=2175907 RepID=A0A8H6MM49_9PEZI|nr:f-box domain containing protein [Colletotrichum sojae]